MVAVVNNEIITASDLKEFKKNYGRSDTQRNLLHTLIDEKLSQQIIKKLRLSPSDEEVDAEIANILKGQGLTQSSLIEFLKQRGLSFKQYRENIKKGMENERLLEREIKSEISIKEEDIRSYYYSHIKNKETAYSYHIRQLFFPAESKKAVTEKMKLAEQAYKEFQSGTPFETIIQKYAEEDAQKESLGDLGFVSDDDLIPPLKNAIKTLKLKEISQPIVSPAGVHILQQLGVKKQAEQEYADAKDNIHKALYEQEFKKILGRWLRIKRQEAYIKILLGQKHPSSKKKPE